MSLQRSKIFAAIAALAFATGPAHAQDAGPPATAPANDPRLAGYDTYLRMQANSPFKNTRWQWIGPTTSGGRVTDIAVGTRRGMNRDIYFGTASGGVWKTSNEGINWTPVFENAASATIGDITVAPSNPDIVWAGTGEANIFRTGAAGTGVYKSVDAGKTWQHMGLAKTYTIGRIVIHPKNPDIVYVAASGAEWTVNEDRGVFRTLDGGKTWQKVLFVNTRTGAVDLAMDPVDPRTLYATTWERIRWKWNDPENIPGYKGSGVWKSTDGGANWAPANAGLPDAEFRGRIGIDVARSKPNVLYAFVDNYTIARQGQPGELDSYGNERKGVIRGATMYRSDDKAKTWRMVSDTNAFMMGAVNTFGWVFGNVRVDPVDENRVYFMGLSLNVSTDGGRTFSRVGGTGGDNHALWIDPENPYTVINGNDHALGISYDRTATWRSFRTQVNAVQFFNIAYDMATPFRVYGSVQDEGSRRCAVDLSFGREYIPVAECENAPGGEGSSHAIDWSNPNIVYSSSQYGSLTRAEYGAPPDTSAAGRGGRGGGGRANVGSPVIGKVCAAPPAPVVVEFGVTIPARGAGGRGGDTTAAGRGGAGRGAAGAGGRAGAGGAAGAAAGRGGRGGRGTASPVSTLIKPCETVGDPRQRGNWVAPTIVSPHNPNVLYHGFQALYRSRDRGATWTQVSGDLSNNVRERIGRVPHQLIFTISESPVTAGIIYAGTDDGNVHVTRDYGKTWTNVSSKLPQRLWVNKVVASAFDEGTVYVAQTGRYDDDFGVYLYKSTNYGQTFTSIAGNIPAGSVMAFAEDPKDARILYAGTDQGVYVTTNGGQAWSALGSNLPSVGIYDLIVHPRDDVAVAATHGRGFWVFDVQPVRASLGR